MDKKKIDPNVDKQVAGDPAFYNDQVNNNNEPIKATVDKKKAKADNDR